MVCLYSAAVIPRSFLFITGDSSDSNHWELHEKVGWSSRSQRQQHICIMPQLYSHYIYPFLKITAPDHSICFKFYKPAINCIFFQVSNWENICWFEKECWINTHEQNAVKILKRLKNVISSFWEDFTWKKSRISDKLMNFCFSNHVFGWKRFIRRISNLQTESK